MSDLRTFLKKTSKREPYLTILSCSDIYSVRVMIKEPGFFGECKTSVLRMEKLENYLQDFFKCLIENYQKFFPRSDNDEIRIHFSESQVIIKLIHRNKEYVFISYYEHINDDLAILALN